MGIDGKKTKLFLSLHWIKIIISAAIAVLLILTVIIMSNGLRAWKTAESYLRETQLAQLPLQIFMWMVMGLVQAVIST